MKIWLFNHYATNTYLDHNGRHYELAKYLIQSGYEVKIFCASTVHNSDINMIENGELYREEVCNGIPFVFVRTRNYKGNGKTRVLNMLDFYSRIFKVAKHYDKPDVIIGSSVHPLTCLAAIKLSKKYHCKNIVEIRDLWPESIVAYGIAGRKNPIINALYGFEKRIYTKADQIIFTMEGGRDYIIEKGWDKEHGGSVDINKVHHINNGVDLELFHYNQEHFTFADPDLDNPDIFKVVYTGSIREANLIEKYVDIAQILKTRGFHKIIILIWGSGDCTDKVQRKIDEYGLDNIKLKGRIKKEEVPAVLCRADITTFLCKKTSLIKYGFSLNKSFEYAAAGKPMLVNVNGKYSLLHEFGCGTELDDCSADAFADAIIEYYRMNQDEYYAICRNSLSAANAHDFKLLAGKLKKVIDNLYS